jgi:adenosylhomocysteine nucleosidase
MAFRWLLGDWVRQRVHKTAREKLSEASEQAESHRSSAPEPPCEVGIVFALGIEAGGVEDLLEGVVRIRGHGFAVCRGTLKGRHVALVKAGTGREAAAHATEALIAGHRPTWVISAGFAGGLSPEVEKHDLVMGDSLVSSSGDQLTIDLKVDPEALAETPGVHVGRLLCVDAIVRTPAEKRRWGEAHQALAVDMETFAVAEVCRRRKVRFLAIRIVSDAVDDALPGDVGRIAHQKSLAAKFGAVVGAVWNRPSSVKDMLRLKEDALIASGRLARFLVSVIEQLAN